MSDTTYINLKLYKLMTCTVLYKLVTFSKHTSLEVIFLPWEIKSSEKGHDNLTRVDLGDRFGLHLTSILFYLVLIRISYKKSSV